MRRRGLTLLELMVALGMSIFVLVAITTSYTAAINFDKQNAAVTQATESTITFEDRLRRLIQGAYVSPSTTDSLTCFLGMMSGNGTDSSLSDTLTFTTLTSSVNPTSLKSTDDFETINQNYGPQGGVAEVSLSMTAVGDQGQQKKGLFLRVQQPADGDPTQGGNETVLNADVKTISFEFYDGTQFDPTWGTSGLDATATAALQNNSQTGQDGRRIPAAVRVTYTLNNDPDGVNHILIIQLPQSDVTAENPIAQTATSTAGTTGGTP